MGVIVASLGVVAAVVILAPLTGWLERRMAPGGELGPASPVRVARDVRPERRDTWLYGVGPLVALFGVCAATVVIPLGRDLVAADLGIGVFYYLVMVDFVPLGIALGGWGAATEHGVEACYRAVAQLVAYVVPLGLAVLGPLMMARSLSTIAIVRAQAEAGLPYALVQPLGLALYVVTALMQSFRAPFLEPFAAGIDGGVVGAFGGWRAVAWRLALSGVLWVVAAMGAVLFLAGPAGPLLPGPVWMVVKTAALVVLMLAVGSRLPKLSTAATLGLAWKVLIPVGLVNALLVGGLILAGVGQAPFGGR